MYLINGKGSLIRLLAGTFVIGGSLLGYYVSPNFLFFTMFVGAMLILSSTTGICPMEIFLKLFKIEEKEAK